MPSFKGCHFEKDIILLYNRWYLSYSLSYRHIEEMMEERGIDVDHSTINRWVLKFTPFIEKEFRKKKRPAGLSWRMDETYVSVKGQWKYLCRTVDKTGLTIDFILTAKRDRNAALRFLSKAIAFQKKPSHMIRKGQMKQRAGQHQTFAQQFYSLAA